MSSMGVCKTRHWQTSGLPVLELDICTVEHTVLCQICIFVLKFIFQHQTKEGPCLSTSSAEVFTSQGDIVINLPDPLPSPRCRNSCEEESRAQQEKAFQNASENIHFYTFYSCCMLWRSNKALMTDIISRVIFPLSFVIFNVLYWSFYILLHE